MKKIKPTVIAHIVILSAIVIIIAISAFKLYHWDHNTNNSPIEVIDTGEFDTESEDYYVAVDVSLLENYNDDGKLNIAFVGDNLFGDYQDDTGIPSMVAAQIPDSTVYNLGFSNATMCSKNFEYSEDYGNDALSFYFTSLSIANQEGFDLLRNGTRNAEDGVEDYFMDTIDLMDTIDFSDVDIMVINYGVQDYLDSRTVESTNSELMDPTIFCDALRQGIRWLHAAYPNMQFIVMSPTFCFYENDGTYEPADVYKNDEDSTIASYMIAEKNAAAAENVTFLDNYWGVDINSDNADTYFTDSKQYPNEAGRKLIADKLADTIQNRIYYRGGK